MKKRYILLLIVVIFMITLLSSCNKADEPSIEDTINNINAKEYVRIYGNLSAGSKQKISMNEFCNIFEVTYDKLTLTYVTPYINDILSPEEKEQILLADSDNETIDRQFLDCTTVYYTNNLDTQMYGQMSFEYKIHFIKEDEEWKIVFDESMVFPGMDKGDKLAVTLLEPLRGEIFDCNANLLAKNDHAITVYANIDKIDDGEAFIRTIAPLIGTTENYVSEKIAEYFKIVERNLEIEQQQELIEAGTDIPEEEILTEYTGYDSIVVLQTYDKSEGIPEYIEEQMLTVAGLGIDTSSMTRVRTYPYGQFMCHTLGYVGVVSAEEVSSGTYANLPSSAIVGKDGIEKKYNSTLQGEYGFKIDIIGENGVVASTPYKKKAVSGTDIWLTIDVNTQLRTEMLLMQQLTDEMAGCVVVLDPTTGEIESIASNPGYNPNEFVQGISVDRWNEISDPESNNPMYNRATSGRYPPGSTFKPFTAAIAMDTNSVSYDYVMHEKIENNEWLPDRDDWVYPAITRFSATGGSLNLRNAMINSDNIYFAFAALEVGSQQFYEEMQRIGFDTAISTDIDVATPRISNDGVFGKINLLADTGYGQGEMLISPLQMAAMFGAFANSGDIMSPYIIESTRGYVDDKYQVINQTQPTIWREDVVTSYSVTKIDSLLKEVVAIGTGNLVKISGLNIYGKTGTAEIGNDKSREIAWFIGYVYYPEPRLVCVTIEVPAGEGAVRYDIAKTLLSDSYYETDGGN